MELFGKELGDDFFAKDWRVESMPADDDLFSPLGEFLWASTRLHCMVRDMENALEGRVSDNPFDLTLGQAISGLKTSAQKATDADEIIEWVEKWGDPVNYVRNAVVHSVAFTAEDGKQALSTFRRRGYVRLTPQNVRLATRLIIGADLALYQAKDSWKEKE